MHVAFINPQGNFDPEDSYWTAHPDFGGQLVYVKELALAMGNLGHSVDVVASRGTKRIAVEIETGDSDIKHNIDADLKAGFTYVLTVPTNPRAERKTEELLARERERYADRVRLVPARTIKIKARPSRPG